MPDSTIEVKGIKNGILIKVNDGEWRERENALLKHIDQNLAGKEFPEENFVFTGTFKSLLRGLSSDGGGSESEQD